MEEMYRRSLRAIDAELTGLLAFAFEFKDERSSERLSKAQETIREEIKISEEKDN